MILNKHFQTSISAPTFISEGG